MKRHDKATFRRHPTTRDAAAQAEDEPEGKDGCVNVIGFKVHSKVIFIGRS